MPLQILHIDITIFKCLDNTKAYIYVIKDNFSKAILHCTAKCELKAMHTIEGISSLYEQYCSLLPTNAKLMSDAGSENSGLKNWIACNDLSSQMEHIIAQIDTHFSNSRVEAGNRAIKYYGLYKQPIADFEALQKMLPIIVEEQLHKPMHDLDGRTPYEVLHDIPYPSAHHATETITPQLRIQQNKVALCFKGLSF